MLPWLERNSGVEHSCEDPTKEQLGLLSVSDSFGVLSRMMAVISFRCHSLFFLRDC